MKKIIYALFITLSVLFSAKAHPPGLTNLVEVQCRNISQGDLLIFTNDIVRIELSKSDVIDSLNDWIEKHDIDRDKTLLKYLKESSGNVLYSDMSRTLQSRAEFRISDLLQKGKVKLFDIKKGEYLNSYISAEWGFQSAPLVGAGEKVFLLKENKVQFLKIMEWIS